MKPVSHSIASLLVALCLVLATFAEAQARLVFTGRPTLIVVSGYSTSATWPRILQRKLDRYYGGKRVVEVKSAKEGQ